MNLVGQTTDRQVELAAAEAVRTPSVAGSEGGFESRLGIVVGLSAIGFSVIYLASDVIEVVQGGFSTFRLCLTYAGEAAIPLFVMGLYALQRPRISLAGLFGAIAYAYSYVFFTSTVVYAIVARTPDYSALTKTFGSWMTLHGVLMCVGGITLGASMLRAAVLPRWTAICLMVGVLAVAAASDLGAVTRTLAEAVVALAFMGMGAAALRSKTPRSKPSRSRSNDAPTSSLSAPTR